MKYVLLLFLNLSISTVFAANQCELLFSNQKTVVTPAAKKNQVVVEPFNTPQLQEFRSGLIDTRKFAAQKFEVSQNGQVYDLSGVQRKLIGQLRVIETDRLFQWADQDYQKDIFDHRGIDRAWMDSIINDDPQVAGVGFYASTHPFDSGEYGDTLTVFEIKKPIVLFEARTYQPYSKRLIGSHLFAERMRAAGVDGFRYHGYVPTWISLINEKILQKPRSISSLEITPFLNVYDSNGSIRFRVHVDKVLKTKQKEIPAQVKKLPAYKLMMGQKLDFADLIEFYKNIDRIYSIEDQTEIVKQTRNLLFSDLSFKDLMSLITVFRQKAAVMPERILDGIYTYTVDEKTNEKIAILDMFDVQTVAALSKKSVAQQEKILGEFAKEAVQFKNDLSKLSGADITNYDAVLKFARESLGLPYKYRDYLVSMSNDNYGRDLNMPLEASVAQRLGKNKLLNLTYNGVNPKTDLQNVGVDYANKKAFINYFGLYNGAHQWSLEKVISIVMPRFFNEKILYTNYSSSLTDLISNYQTFLSLHPFEDGNGRFSRLLFYILKVRKYGFGNQTLNDPIFSLPVYNLDLFLSPSEFQEHLAIGVVLNTWIAASPDNQTMIERSQQAMQILKDQYPQYSALMY